MPIEVGYAEMIERMPHEMVSRTINTLTEELTDLPVFSARYNIKHTCLVWCYYVLETRYLLSRIDI